MTTAGPINAYGGFNAPWLPVFPERDGLFAAAGGS
jgi:hypothetical protein